jgi:hypothetical protein
LLAGRRIPADADLDVNDPEALEVMKGKFGRALLNIYKHYADMADRRRSQELDRDNKTSEGGVGMSNIYKPKTLTKKDNHNLEVASQSTKISSRARDLRKFHDTIGYIEFFKVESPSFLSDSLSLCLPVCLSPQFTHDFKLKSTALLTAIQVGDIYLTSVPLSNENRDMRVMTFDTFCSSVILMALIAYRESLVPPADKVKAILLFMWRAVNSNETALKAVNDRYGVSSRTVQGHAGSLNIHGSGLFSDLFLLSWQADGFPNYITLETKKEDPTEVLSKIVRNHTLTSPVKEQVLHVIDDVQQAIKVANRRARVERMDQEDQEEMYGSGGGGDDRGGYGTMAMGSEEEKRNRFRTISADGGAAMFGGEPAALYGYHIAELFARKPELAELIYLEMRHSQLTAAGGGHEA